MSENKKALNIKNKITIILSLILVFIVLGSFIYSIITLILEPVSIITVENRKNISRRKHKWLYNKRRKSTKRRTLSKRINRNKIRRHKGIKRRKHI